jgi:CelD/BcsL family acetyltransferase involved in cellulose biosynthesis
LWTATTGNTLVGAALLIQRLELRKGIPVRCLYVNTAGEGADSVTVEHNAPLIRTGYESAAWTILGDTLRALPWDELILPGSSVANADQICALFPEWNSVAEHRPAPYVTLDRVREAQGGLLSVVSANTRRQLLQAARVAAEKGGVFLEEAKCTRARAEYWEELKALHTVRWQGRGKAGAFSRPRWVDFHQRLHKAAPEATRLFRLRAGNETVAVLYLLQHGKHTAFYQSGVRVPAGDNRQRPGLLLQQAVIDRMATEGQLEYDFLASSGPEIRYKRSLATDERVLSWVTVIRPTWRSRTIAGLKAARSALRAHNSPEENF